MNEIVLAWEGEREGGRKQQRKVKRQKGRQGVGQKWGRGARQRQRTVTSVITKLQLKSHSSHKNGDRLSWTGFTDLQCSSRQSNAGCTAVIGDLHCYTKLGWVNAWHSFERLNHSPSNTHSPSFSLVSSGTFLNKWRQQLYLPLALFPCFLLIIKKLLSVFLFLSVSISLGPNVSNCKLNRKIIHTNY